MNRITECRNYLPKEDVAIWRVSTSIVRKGRGRRRGQRGRRERSDSLFSFYPGLVFEKEILTPAEFTSVESFLNLLEALLILMRKLASAPQWVCVAPSWAHQRAGCRKLGWTFSDFFFCDFICSALIFSFFCLSIIYFYQAYPVITRKWT